MVTGLATLPPPAEPDAALLRVVVVLLLRRVVEGAGVGAGVEAAEAAVVAGVATGFTSTVLFAAALLRVVRRRGVGDGVAMGRREWKRNGNGGRREGSLSVRIPVIDDPADGQIGKDLVVLAGMPGG